MLTLPSRPYAAAKCPSLMAQRVGFPTGPHQIAVELRAELVVGSGCLPLNRCLSGSRGPEAFCPGQGYFHRTGNPLLFSLPFLHFHPLCPETCVLLTVSPVEMKQCNSLVQPSIVCLTSSFCIWPDGIS